MAYAAASSAESSVKGIRIGVLAVVPRINCIMSRVDFQEAHWTGMWNVVVWRPYLNVGGPNRAPVTYSDAYLDKGIRHVFYEGFQKNRGHFLTL